MPSSTSRGYRAPVGLLGLMMTMALVRGRDLGLDILQVGIPISLLVAHDSARDAAGKGCARRPERIVGAGDQNLVAIVEQRVHAKG